MVKHIKVFEDFKSDIKNEIPNEILNNSNLYHSTDMDSLYMMLFQNKLAGSTPQEINGEMFRGVSCTRDKNFIYKNKEITIELKSTVSDKYRCVEVDFFKTNYGKDRTIEHGLIPEDEKETFVITGKINSDSSISPLSKYLTSIKINKKGLLLNSDIIEVLEIDFNKIKIYDYIGKDITKKYIKKKDLDYY